MTYSILAVDGETGEVGAAVQSHWFSVGAGVPRVRPGIGAAVSQAIADPFLALEMLDALGRNEAPADAVESTVGLSASPDHRQLAVISVNGTAAAYTGSRCTSFAGHIVGPGYTVQGNMLASADAWPAMERRFLEADGPLGRRLLQALLAAEEAGGDIRGRQSAAILVAPAVGKPWRLGVDLRVDDHPEPLVELARLLDLRDAYAFAKLGDEHAAAQRDDEAARCYHEASVLAPGNHELLFWSGVAAVAVGHEELGMARVREAVSLHPPLSELLLRLGDDVAAASKVRAALNASQRERPQAATG